jgi:hypothetical protein
MADWSFAPATRSLDRLFVHSLLLYWIAKIILNSKALFELRRFTVIG